MPRRRSAGWLAAFAADVAPRRELARDAEHAEAIAAIRRHVDLENRVIEAQMLRDRRADRRVSVQQQQAVDVVDEPELLGRAQHAVRLHAAQLGGADVLAVRQHCADARERRLDAGGHVRRAADDLIAGPRRRRRRTPTAGPRSDAARRAARRPRRCCELAAASGSMASTSSPEVGELGSGTLGVSAELDPIAQPVEIYTHGVRA